ncbi:hypothetical protein Dimus_023207 [Dionaea muscipula]
MVKFSITNNDGDDEFHPASSDRDRETKRRRTSSSQPSSTLQPHPCPRPIGEERVKSGQPEDGDSSKPFSVILSDPDVFDCPICFDHLTLPVMECGNGHIACSSCCAKLQNKCPSCCKPIGCKRNRAIEKAIESVKIYCCYADYGCKALVSYCQVLEHEKTCTYAPCSCPFVGCLFRGSAPKLSQHICVKHSDLVVGFCYGFLFPICPKWDTKTNKFIDNKNDKFIVLQEESDGVQFVVERHEGRLSVKCVEACPDKGSFSYDLIVRHGTSSLRFQSSTKCVEAQMGDPLASDGLLLPFDFYASDINIQLCIWCKDASPPDIGEGI